VDRYSQPTDEALMARWHELRAVGDQHFTAWLLRAALEDVMRRRGIPLPNSRLIDLQEERTKRRGDS
jgi:hypothetical protein